MFVSFESLPGGSRVWVFQANRPLNAEEVKLMESKLQEFTQSWVVHGSPFNTSYKIVHSQFIILAADETQYSASGCSIDSSVRVLKELGQVLGLELLDRNQVAFWVNGGVMLVPLHAMKQKFQEGTLNEDTLAFNNLVQTKKDLDENWLVPAGQTWLKRYIQNPLAKVKSVS